MKKQIQILTAIAALAFCGCASVEPGHETLVVRAEQLAASAVEIFDGFTRFEYENREALAKTPEIKQAADRIRVEGHAALERLRLETVLYKADRSAANESSLHTALSVINVLLREAQLHLAQAQTITQIQENP